MNIDLSKIITNVEEELLVENDVIIPLELLENSEIKTLKQPFFKGTITKLYDDDYEIEGTLTGTMVLADAITLEDVDYNFEVEIKEEFNEFGTKNENNLKIVKNSLDITEFLWQNILVEVPLKVVAEKNKDLKLEGNGWRLITEEDLNLRNNSPFSELEEKFNSRKEWEYGSSI